MDKAVRRFFSRSKHSTSMENVTEEEGPMVPDLGMIERRTPSAPTPTVQSINLEVDLKVEILANKEVTDRRKLVAPLANLVYDYIGNPWEKTIWTALAIYGCFHLEHEGMRGGFHLYSGSICKGINLQVSKDGPVNIDRVMRWSQSLQYLTDGVRTSWTIKGETYYTRVPYPTLKGNGEMVQFLDLMGVKSFLDGDSLIFIM